MFPGIAASQLKAAAGGGGPDYIASTLSAAQYTSAVTATHPAGIAVGDLMVAMVQQHQNASVRESNTPAGWTKLAKYTLTNQAEEGDAYYKIVEAGDIGGSTGFTWGGGNERIIVSICAFSGAAAPVSETFAFVNSGSVVTAPGFTLAAGSVYLAWFGYRTTSTNNSISVEPAGLTKIVNGVYTDGAVAIYRDEAATAGAISDKSITTTNAFNSGADRQGFGVMISIPAS